MNDGLMMADGAVGDAHAVVPRAQPDRGGAERIEPALGRRHHLPREPQDRGRRHAAHHVGAFASAFRQPVD